MATMGQRITSALRPYKRMGLNRRELAKRMGLKKKQKEGFEAAIREMLARNALMERDGKLICVDADSLVPGEIVKVSGTFGFARPDGSDRDVFVPGRLLAGAMPGDRVLLRLSPSRSGNELDEGEVMRITQQSDKPFSGVLQVEDGVYSVLPDHSMRWPIPVTRGGVGDAKPGDKVMAAVARRGSRHSEHTVRVMESFGSAQNAAASSRAVLAELDIPLEFPGEALEQAKTIGAFEGFHPNEVAARADLRGLAIFTIDGADSKDLDDAISLLRRENGWELGVHIADVSHYVTPRSPLDDEALRRGTSVYYADQVIPMLPPELSNGICSLNPGEDRLAFSCIITLDSEGRMQDYRFLKSVIRSRVKGIYSELNALLENAGDSALMAKYDEIWEPLLRMKPLAQRMITRRLQNGKMELEGIESKIIVDETGQPVDVMPRKQGFCEKMIEEFMLLANEAAASYAVERELPFVYRVHEEPSAEKLETLKDMLEKMNIQAAISGGAGISARLGGILSAVVGGPYAGIVNTLILRSMSKAKYSQENIGHFGLQLGNYAHFTSPIRRYPDLTIHRIMSASVAGTPSEQLRRRFGAFVAVSAEQSTRREIAAVTAERDCEDRYKAQYMRRFIGEKLAGVVSGCAAYGAYVLLPNTCEGLVRLADFPQGDWSFDGAIAFLSRTGKPLRLGDPVTVEVLAADVSSGQVDFRLAEIG